MKKFAYVLLFLLILSLIYLGFGYYSNHITSKKIQLTTDKINSILSSDPRVAALNKTITLKTSLENKSLFQSDYKLTFQVTDNNANPNDRNARKRFTLNLTSENGLFPLSNVKKLNFTPVLNKMTLEFPPNLLSKQYLERIDIDKSAPLGSVIFIMPLDDSIEITALFSALRYNHPDFPLAFEGGEVKLHLTQNDLISSLSADLKALDIKINSPWIPIGHIIDNVFKQTEQSTRHHFKFKKFKIDYTINPSSLNFFSSEKALEIEDFSFSILQYPILKLSSFIIKQAQIDRSNIIEIENNVKLNDLNLYGLNMGSGYSTFISLHRNFDAVNTFYNSILQDIKEGKYKKTSLNTELSISDFIIAVKEATQKLVSNPGYQIIPFHWENSKGSLTIKSELIFSNPLTYGVETNKEGITSESAYDKINTFHIDVRSQRGMLPYLMTQLDQINGIEQLVASQKNNQIIEDNLDFLINTGIISLNNEFIQLVFSFANDRYVLNGVPYTRKQFLEFISLVSLRQTGLISPENLIRLNKFISDQTAGG